MPIYQKRFHDGRLCLNVSTKASSMNRQLIGILFLAGSISLSPGIRTETLTLETGMVPAAVSASREQHQPGAII
jgi:hypothetical protein